MMMEMGQIIKHRLTPQVFSSLRAVRLHQDRLLISQQASQQASHPDNLTSKSENKMNLGKFDCSTGLINILYNDPIKNISVRNGVITDTLLIDKLQKENSNAVGFIQKTIWDKYVFGGERNFVVFICEANNEAVGYVLITPARGVLKYAKIQQIAVRNDARRLHYGTALLDVCRQFCETFNRAGFTLRCRVDLESNKFWKALGFVNYGKWEKGKVNHVGFKASNDINLWKIDLNKNLFSLFPETEKEEFEIYEKPNW
jgi:GNAT superfamily N-acetyltransferase